MSLKSLKTELSSIQDEKRRPPDDVARRYNELPYGYAHVVFQIPLYAFAESNNWMCLQVESVDDETLRISTYANEIVFKDEDLKPDKEGKIIIDLEPLQLESICGGVDLPQEFELPSSVLNPRKEKRRLKALAKDAILIDHDRDPWMYYYAEGDQVRILQGNKEVTASIEMVYGKPAVNVEALQLEAPYLELPEEVARKFKHVIDTKRLQNLTLLHVGKSLLDGKEYYQLNGNVPDEFWNKIQHHFEDFGNGGDLRGWLTCEPERVASILHIPMQ